VVARPRRQFPGQLLLPHPEPVDLPFQPLQLLFCHTPIPRNPSPGTRPIARGQPCHGSRPPPGTPPLQVLVDPAPEKRQPPIPQQGHHMIRHPLQEIPIMTHHHDRPFPPVQQVFQAGQRIHIKIVSRLIQQQHIGLPHQDSQQLHPSPLPARQLPGGSKLHVPPQPQSVQQAPHRPRTLPRVHIPPNGRHHLARRQPRIHPLAPLLHVSQPPRLPPQHPPPPPAPPLPPRPRPTPRRGLLTPAPHFCKPLQDRCLPAPVRPQPPNPSPGPELPPHVVEQPPPASTRRQVENVDHGLPEPRRSQPHQFDPVTGRRLIGDERVGGFDAEPRLAGASWRPAPEPSQFLAQQVAPPPLGGVGDP